MCEETPVVVYCVGYALPISCCLAGVGLSCFGCYRYYHAACIRAQRQREVLAQTQIVNREQRIIKRDTLKTNMIDAFMKSIKNLKGSSSKNKEKDSSLKDTCPICIQEYDQDTKKVFIGLIKGCGHYFHFDCIWEWLERKRDCPICREKCELTETDIRGLSLEQALIISCEEVAVPSTSKVPLESHSNTSTLTSTGSFGHCVTIITTPEISVQFGELNNGFDSASESLERQSSNGDVEVVVAQPKSVKEISQIFEQPTEQ